MSVLCWLGIHKRSVATVQYRTYEGGWRINRRGGAYGGMSGADWLELCPRCYHVICYWTCPGDAVVTKMKELGTFENVDDLVVYLKTNKIEINFLRGRVAPPYEP